MSGEKKTPLVRRVGSLIVLEGQAIPYERILNVVPVDEGAGAEIFIKGEREKQVNYIPVAMPFEEVVEAIGWSEPGDPRDGASDWAAFAQSRIEMNETRARELEGLIIRAASFLRARALDMEGMEAERAKAFARAIFVRVDGDLNAALLSHKAGTENAVNYL